MSDTKDYQLADRLSLMHGEDPEMYASLYRQVEDAVKPKDVCDQMMVSDITNHFWEQQRLRRCSGTIVNAARYEALVRILTPITGYDHRHAAWLADIYFGAATDDETKSIASNSGSGSAWGDALAAVRAPDSRRRAITRTTIIAVLQKHGLDESAIDSVAIQGSLGALAGIENLTLKHELRREAIFREVERRRKKRAKRREGGTRLNGKARAQPALEHLPEEPSPPMVEMPS